MQVAHLVVLLLISAASPEPPKLVEVRHVGVDYHFSGIVPKWSGGAFVTVDRNAGTWNLVSVKETLPPRWRHVYGCDDEGLVMNYSAAETGRGLIWLRPAGQP